MAAYYLNAEAVLPPDLLDAVSKALHGRCAFLWVPVKRNLSRDRRDRQVVAMNREGLDAHAIADAMFLSERTVYRILARKRAPAAPSATAVGTVAAQPSPPEVEVD